MKRTVLPEQAEAWAYYGTPTLSVRSRGQSAVNPVGEVRYIIGWAADQMSRMEWDVMLDGSAEWSVEVGGERIESKVGTDISLDESNAKASEKLLEHIGWTERTVRQVTTNLYVAGELDYVAIGDKEWEVVSVVRPNRDEIIEKAALSIRGLWPHPADPEKPDAPLFAVLPVLEEMDWISKLSRSQSANRVSMRGIVGAADGLSFANGGDFWDEWDKALHARMDDPTDVGPLQIRGAQELVEPSGAHGMKGLSWVIPDFPYDSRLDMRMEALIHRLAYGLPIPPEVLLGLQAQSRATAFQVEENSYRAHIEPPAWLVAHVATQALSKLLPEHKVEVIPDPSLLLARRHTTQDVKDAFDRGAVSYDYLRAVLGIPDTAAPTEQDIEQMLLVNGAVQPDAETRDPAERSRVSGAPGTPDRSQSLGELLGASIAATAYAKERVGARARTYNELRDIVDKSIPNVGVPHALGAQTMIDAGVPIGDVVVASLSNIGDWWLKNTGSQKSADLLVDLMASHVMDNLELEEIVPLPMKDITKVLQSLAD